MGVPGLCGTEVDRYRIDRWLGGGGFGDVYRATHTVVGRAIALKVLDVRHLGSDHVVQRFFREARAAASVGSPHIVHIYDAGVSREGLPFLAMELIDGIGVDELARGAPISPVRAVHIVAQLLDGLAAAHEANIVHRDIKPANIMLEGTQLEAAPGRALDRVKLVDFGVSKIRGRLDERQTKTNAALGTPGYGAPEQFLDASDVDARADIFSSGVVLYRLLSAQLPFEADSYEAMIVRMHQGEPTPLAARAPGLHPKLLDIVDRAVRRRPEERWASARDMAIALREVSSQLSSTPAQITTPPPARVHGPLPGGTPGTADAPPSHERARTRSEIALAATVAAGSGAPAGVAPMAESTSAVLLPSVSEPQAGRRVPAWLLPVVGVVSVLGAALTGALVVALLLEPPSPPPAAQPLDRPGYVEGPDTVDGEEPLVAGAQGAGARPPAAALEEASPAEASPVEASPAEASPAEASPAEASPAEARPAEARPAEARPEAVSVAPAEPSPLREPPRGRRPPRPVRGRQPMRTPRMSSDRPTAAATEGRAEGSAPSAPHPRPGLVPFDR